MNGIEIGRYFRVWFVDQKNITGSGNVENDEGWWKAEGHQMSQEARLGVWRGKASDEGCVESRRESKRLGHRAISFFGAKKTARAALSRS